MGENYGRSFAAKLIEDERFEEALVAGTEAEQRDRLDPEPILDRARALLALERWTDAVDEVERAMKLDEEAGGILETDLVDDTVFQALLGEARMVASSDLSRALAQLTRYGKVMPSGRHLADVQTWSGRLRGEGKNDVIVKDFEGTKIS
ncbi:MAG: hypothetical protein ABI321_15225 [Polyangia bacterium]